nr:hypothetical protein [Tanacetum cinerariifolium]
MEAIGAHNGVTQASRDIVPLYNEYMPTSRTMVSLTLMVKAVYTHGAAIDDMPSCFRFSRGSDTGVPPPANNKGYVIK